MCTLKFLCSQSLKHGIILKIRYYSIFSELHLDNLSSNKKRVHKKKNQALEPSIFFYLFLSFLSRQVCTKKFLRYHFQYKISYWIYYHYQDKKLYRSLPWIPVFSDYFWYPCFHFILYPHYELEIEFYEKFYKISISVFEKMKLKIKVIVDCH